MTIVLDTNVLVSGLLIANHAPGRILDLISAGRLRLALDDRIVAEYEEVLSRPCFRRYFPIEKKELIMAFIRSDSVRCACADTIHDLPDPDDVPFAEVALAAAAPLVTGNLKHFPAAVRRQILVLTPAQFIAEF